MTTLEGKIRNFVLEEDSSRRQLRISDWPAWLKTSRWKPTILFATKGSASLLAVDVAPSGALPMVIYREVVRRLLAEHSNLHIIVCVPEARYEEHPETQRICQQFGITIKVYVPGVGLEAAQLEPSTEAPAVPSIEETGWFPSPIVEIARGLPNLVFAPILNIFARRISTSPRGELATLAIVRETVDSLLQSHPYFRANPAPFMRLANFEALLKTQSTDFSDHVFHSFRVFLAGCPIISRFYSVFEAAHNRFRICPPEQLCVEYSWLLAALFHDIGRTKEGMLKFISTELDDDELEIAGKKSRWAKAHYQSARRILGSIGAFVAARDEVPWDGGSCEDEQGKNLSEEWMLMYDKLDKHGVISAYDILADILKKMMAADERKFRTFTVSHAAPAALAILLHDHRVWDRARQWGLLPVDISQNPLAALLIYIDTWDDYRRRGAHTPIHIQKYAVDSAGAEVTIEWKSREGLEAERFKYKHFSEALTGGPPSLVINPIVART